MDNKEAIIRLKRMIMPITIQMVDGSEIKIPQESNVTFLPSIIAIKKAIEALEKQLHTCDKCKHYYKETENCGVCEHFKIGTTVDFYCGDWEQHAKDKE